MSGAENYNINSCIVEGGCTQGHPKPKPGKNSTYDRFDSVDKPNQIFSTNLTVSDSGLSHKFSSDISISGLNSGFFISGLGDYTATGISAGDSIDYSLVDGITFTIGGKSASGSDSYGNETPDPIEPEFYAHTQAFDSNFSTFASTAPSWWVNRSRGTN